MNELTTTLVPRAAILIDENFRGFNGEIYDSPSGCYLLGNGYRPYNPIMRAFLTRDSFSPFGPTGANRYQYCHLDPINFADPSGHLEVNWWAIGGIILGVLGAVAGVILAIPTGGASLSLVAVGAAVIAVGAGAAAVGTGIASLAYSNSDPAYSEKLGHISFALGGLSTAAASISVPFAPAVVAWTNTTKGLAFAGGVVQGAGVSLQAVGIANNNERSRLAGVGIWGLGAVITTAGVAGGIKGALGRSPGSYRGAMRESYAMRDILAKSATGKQLQPPGLGTVTGGLMSMMRKVPMGV